MTDSDWATPTSYEDIERDLTQMGEHIGIPSSDRVPGVNVITPEVVGTWRLADGRIVELAYGNPMMGSSWLYGVTVRTPTNMYCNGGGCFHTLDAVWSHLLEMYHEANRGTLGHGQEDDPAAEGI